MSTEQEWQVVFLPEGYGGSTRVVFGNFYDGDLAREFGRLCVEKHASSSAVSSVTVVGEPGARRYYKVNGEIFEREE